MVALVNMSLLSHPRAPAISVIMPVRNGAEWLGEAVASIRDLVCDAIKHGGKITGLGIEIVDENGKVLETLRARVTFD